MCAADQACLRAASPEALLDATAAAGVTFPHPTLDGARVLEPPMATLARDGAPCPVVVGANTNESR